MNDTIYTPDDWLTVFADVLIHHPHTVKVRMALASVSTCKNNNNNNNKVRVWVDLLTRDDDDDDDDAATGTLEEGSLRYVVEVDESMASTKISARWCADLQRQLCVVSLLLATPPTSSSSSSFAMHDDALHRTCTSSRYSIFVVHLFPYTPQLRWRREVDGVFGSAYAALRQQPFCLPRRQRCSDDDQDDAQHSLCSALVRVAVVVNAVLPWTCARAGKDECHILMMHAPGARLATASTTIAMNDDDGDAVHHRFDLMKKFCTQHVVPQMPMSVLHATWGDSACSTSANVADNVGGVASLGTTYACQRLPPSISADSSSSTHVEELRSVVVVLDLPNYAWQWLHRRDQRAAQHSHVDDDDDDDVEQHLRRHVGRLVEEAVRAAVGTWHRAQLSSADGVATATTTTSTNEVGKKGGAPSRAALVKSLASSVHRILFMSENPVFVREAERLLFRHLDGGDDGATSCVESVPESVRTQAHAWKRRSWARYSEKEVHVALEQRLLGTS